MQLLLAFSPFLAFLVGERHLGLVPALCLGALVAAALVVRERLRGARETRVLEVGTALCSARSQGAQPACRASRGPSGWSASSSTSA